MTPRVVAAVALLATSARADCDSSMKSLCGAVMGGEAACTTCCGTHASELRAAGCYQSDFDGFCTKGLDPRYKKNITCGRLSYLPPSNVNP